MYGHLLWRLAWRVWFLRCRLCKPLGGGECENIRKNWESDMGYKGAKGTNILKYSKHSHNECKPSRQEIPVTKTSKEKEITGYKVYYTNCRSLRNKMEELRAEIHTDNSDIICLTETWANLENKDFYAEYHIARYQLLMEDRKNRKGGGVREVLLGVFFFFLIVCLFVYLMVTGRSLHWQRFEQIKRDFLITAANR